MRAPFLLLAALVSFVICSGCGGGSDSAEVSTETAKWIFEVGGTLRLEGKVKETISPGELPPAPYQIERINLNETKVKEADLQKLAGLKSVRALSLYRTDIGDEAIPYVIAIPNLTELEISYTRVTDAGLSQLRALPRLKKLYLHGTNGTITDNGVNNLQAAMPKLEIFR